MTAAKCSPNPYDGGRAQWGVSRQPVMLGNYAEPVAPSCKRFQLHRYRPSANGSDGVV
jgi:hypothetical protein